MPFGSHTLRVSALRWRPGETFLEFFSSAAQRRAASVRMNGAHYRGVVLKRSGGTPETRLRQRFFKQFRPTYTYTHTRQKNSAVLKLSYSAFQ